MAGGITYNPNAGSIPLGRPSAALLVYRYDPEATGDSPRYELLPNIRCLSVTYKEGADPGAAHMRYAFDDPLRDPEDPQRIEEVYPLDATGPRVVSTDDRLVVRAVRDDGYEEILFDGFVQVPQANLGPETEAVSFTVLGTPVREWDTPLAGAVTRDADAPATVSDITTDIPARFNPDGHPNASPASADSGNPTLPDGGSGEYPVFLGPVWPDNAINGETIRPWTLGMAARHIVAVGDPDQKYVGYADLAFLDVRLQSIRPVDKADDGVVNIDDETTWEYEDILVQDIDVTGDPWPVALTKLIEPHGFVFAFTLSETGDGTTPGDPVWGFRIYRKDVAAFPQTVSLQQAGGAYDPGQTNVGAMTLARDTHDVANEIVIDAHPLRVEASFVLAPGFTPAAGDMATPDNFKENSANFTGANRDKYRVWIFDECSEGHWDKGTSAFITTKGGDFTKVLQQKDDKDRPFVKRRRPGLRTLVSVDDLGKPLHAMLHVSFDYAGDQPGVWDGSSGTWQEVVSGDWQLLHDRLGFRVTCENPNGWFVGDKTDSPLPQIAGGKLSLVDQVNGGAAYPIFRLTCTIDADQDFNVTAPARVASPTRFAIQRRLDARDRFRKTIVSQYSVNGQNGVADDVVTDDTTDAQAYADAQRRHTEAGTFGGSITIPRLSTAYRIGDQIASIDGRNVSLRSNAAAEQNESPIYPMVVAISYEFDGQQTTTLDLSDGRAAPAPRRSKGYQSEDD